MSVEHSGHQPWRIEPETLSERYPDSAAAETLDYLQAQDAGEAEAFYADVPQPPLEPASYRPARQQLYITNRSLGGPRRTQDHRPAWAKTEEEPFDALSPDFPLKVLEPAFGTPIHADLLRENLVTAPGIKVMSLHERGPLVKAGEPGSIFSAMDRALQRDTGATYQELKQPVYAAPPSFDTIIPAARQIGAAPKLPELPAPAPEAPEQSIPEIRVITNVEPVLPIAETTVSQDLPAERVPLVEIQEERSALEPAVATAFLERVLAGLYASREADRQAEQAAAEVELAKDAQVIEAAVPVAEAVAEPVVTTPERQSHPATHVREEHLTLSGIRTAAKELVAQHKKATRIAEYAGVAAVAVVAGARLFGRLRRR